MSTQATSKSASKKPKPENTATEETTAAQRQTGLLFAHDGLTQRFTFTDGSGRRTFLFPEAADNSDVYNIISDLRNAERLTGTRLRDGKNPLWYLLMFRSYEREGLYSRYGVTFAEHVKQHRWADLIEVVGQTLTEGAAPADNMRQLIKTITCAVAITRFNVSRTTLRRHAKEGKLRDFRKAGHSQNAPLVFDLSELESQFQSR